jgi:hypothetical protein
MLEQKDKVLELCPSMRYIEIVAFLQAKWETLSIDEKVKYEYMTLERMNELEEKESDI